jgi:hypothetical protein
MVCALSAGAGAAKAADQRPQGLLWNHTGLPAVLPLQIKTDPGRDYVVTLIDAQSGEAALAAYVRGGAFFQVLVPPGRFELHFAGGTDWQGEERLFGPGAQTQRFRLSTSLNFGVRGPAIKAGHLVDLRQMTLTASGEVQAAIKPSRICQTVSLLPRQFSHVIPIDRKFRPDDRTLRRYDPLRYGWHRARQPGDLTSPWDRDALRWRDRPPLYRFPDLIEPRYQVRARPC